MKRPKILAIDYAFPPIAMPRAIQVSRLLKHLDASTVVICGEDPYAKLDPSIAPTIETDVDLVLRVPFRRSIVLRAIDYVSSNLRIPFSNLPDLYRGWNKHAYRRFLEWQEISGYRPDILLTFGQPMSDHLFGLMYRRKTNVSWIAHFSDPWVENPYHLDDPLTRWVNQKMEDQVMREADGIVFTSPETIDLVMRKYPASWRQKVFYLPHCYDSDLYDDKLAPPENSYVIRSIGMFYGRRSVKPLYEALEKIAQDTPTLLSNGVFEVIGGTGSFDPRPYRLAERKVHLLKEVPYAESLRLMQTAHCLLVIDAPADASVFFPSKLVDYIGSGRFIAALSPPGAVSRIVSGMGGLVADPTDQEAVIKLLMEVLQKRPERIPLQDSRYEKNVVSKEMLDIIQRTVTM